MKIRVKGESKYHVVHPAAYTPLLCGRLCSHVEDRRCALFQEELERISLIVGGGTFYLRSQTCVLKTGMVQARDEELGIELGIEIEVAVSEVVEIETCSLPADILCDSACEKLYEREDAPGVPNCTIFGKLDFMEVTNNGLRAIWGENRIVTRHAYCFYSKVVDG